MLYVTTRSNQDYYTANRALQEMYAPDGGIYLPMRIPQWSRQQIQDLRNHTFFENFAHVLNLFFPVSLTPWDVKICFGRNPIAIVSVGPKIAVVEFWHSLDSSYQAVAKRIYSKMSGTIGKTPSRWASVAIRIAALFALFADERFQDEAVDIALTADAFDTPAAVWYAREMGLPMGKMIYACNDSDAVWDLLQRGVYGPQTGEQDREAPSGLELLISVALGTKENRRFLESCREKTPYVLSPEQMQQISRGISPSVVGSHRVSQIISSVFHSHQYLMDPYTALAFGCLQDYRATTGEAKHTLLLADRSPQLYLQSLAEATGISQEKLQSLINHQ